MTYLLRNVNKVNSAKYGGVDHVFRGKQQGEITDHGFENICSGGNKKRGEISGTIGLDLKA